MILTAADIDVVGEAADGLEAIDVVRRSRPEVVLMDIRMPSLDGIEATRRIVADPALAAEPPRVIILTTFDLDRYVYDALSAGAAGFLLKNVTPEHLAAAVRLIRTGDALLAPTITRRLVARFARGAPDGSAPIPRRDISQLTSREIEVLEQMARGLSNTELAEHFQVSQATIKTHVARILAKLQARDRVQAVIAAYQAGLATAAPPPHADTPAD
jgi:DNA-binding NarL/FixJ family response regulator